MFLLSKLFAYIFLSPALILVLLMFGIYFTARGREKESLFFLALVVFVLYGLSVRPVAEFIVYPLEHAYRAVEVKKVSTDLIVVLGGGVTQGSPEFAGTPTAVLSESSLRRVVKAWQLYKIQPRPIIVCGGTVLARGIPEGRVMADQLIDFGVPVSDIIIEPHSRNTYENVDFIYSILRRRNAHSVALITSAKHMPRSVAVFKARHVRVQPVPCDYATSKAAYQWFDLFPLTEYLETSFSGLKEYIGLVYYKVYYKI